MRLLPLLALAVACQGAGQAAGADDSAGPAEFCDTLDDVGLTQAEEGGGNATSGELSIKVVTDQSDDPHEPLYVAFKDFLLENVNSGGVQTTGKTSSDGLVEELLGPGTWAFQASYTRGSTVCTADLQADVSASTTTTGCALMTCPD